ncbi:hypothetical protein [Sulfuriflexus sp.]|uniref:ArnT family glycosyltransferase n=1 Tax=Sulfuriflexus sp. TaxID=2015443 RepID=UPI0028CD7AB7|nr:hypothetical protein [Sulfuriflexus sp.]MDT8404854.1 hypothetical protein [Sulfuriflexus sp.]
MQAIVRLLDRDHAWSAVFFGFLISIVVIYNDEVINSDGILYLESARLFLEQGWAAGFNKFHWPFFSLLILVVSKALFISLEHAAYVLNACLLGLLAFTFVRCAQELGGDRKVTLAAAILFLTSVSLNEYRDLIVRDFGYLAFSFSALWLLLRFNRTRLPRHAVLAGVALICATLFRIEGIVFIGLAPLALFFTKDNFGNRLKNALLVWLPAILLLVIAMLFLPLFVDSEQLTTNKLTESVVLLDMLQQGIVEGISAKAELLKSEVLPYYSRNIATQGVIAIIVTIILEQVFSTTGVVVTALLIWGLYKKNIQNQVINASFPLWMIAINLFIITGFVIAQFFIAGRYVLYLALLLILFASFPLARILFRETANKAMAPVGGKLRTLLIIVLAYMLADGMVSLSSDKAYIRDAARWLETNAQGARILSNQEHMYYYTGRYIPWNEMAVLDMPARLSQIPEIEESGLYRYNYDYIVIKIRYKQNGFEDEVVSWVGSQPVYRTENERGDRILIFKNGN